MAEVDQRIIDALIAQCAVRSSG